jgi:hypothetical protein
MNVAAAQIVHWQREWRGNDPVRHRSRYPRQTAAVIESDHAHLKHTGQPARSVFSLLPAGFPNPHVTDSLSLTVRAYHRNPLRRHAPWNKPYLHHAGTT